MKVAIYLFILFSIDVYGVMSALLLNKLVIDEPDFFQIAENVAPCNEDDPHLNECLKQAFLDMKPELMNILPQDPIVLSPDEANYASRALQGNSSLNNIKIYGKSNFELRDIHLKIKDNIVEVDLELFFPKLVTEAEYSMNLTHAQKNGHINETMTAVNVKHHWIGHLVSVKNHKFLQVDKLHTTPEVGDMKISFTNLGSTPEENERLESLINSQWRKLGKVYLDKMAAHFEPINIEHLNSILGRIPYDSIINEKSDYYKYRTSQMPVSVSAGNLIELSWLSILISLVKMLTMMGY